MLPFIGIDAMRLLLLSNSRNPGGGYLEHAHEVLREFLGAPGKRLLFFPFAAVRFAFDEYARRVRKGAPYIGWSAGANLACPTIRTTNDMPIVEPRSLDAMRLIPFQLNPHYSERALARHGGETRDERIAEFLAKNPCLAVLGLREGTLLRPARRATARSEGRSRHDVSAVTR
jgi:peptidase E